MPIQNRVWAEIRLRGIKMKYKWHFSLERVKATYKTVKLIDEETDKEIKELAALYGLKWYAQGVDFTTGVRDICFDRDINAS